VRGFVGKNHIMNIAYLIIGLIALWILRRIIVLMYTIAKNQVKIGKLIEEINDKTKTK